MEDLIKLTAGNFNFANMRNRIRPEDAPLIPFPGLYQTDLTMIDGSQKSEMKSDQPAAQGGLINFTKQQKIASYITDFLVTEALAIYVDILICFLGLPTNTIRV